MANTLSPIEVLARYWRTTVPITASVLETEFKELQSRVSRWRYDTDYAVALEDRHLIDWKANRGPCSGDLIRHPKAGVAWLTLAREAIANI